MATTAGAAHGGVPPACVAPTPPLPLALPPLPPPEGPRDPIAALPRELGVRIVSMLPLRSVLAARLVSRLWQRVADEPGVWLVLLVRAGWAPHAPAHAWQQLYVALTDLERRWRLQTRRHGRLEAFVPPTYAFAGHTGSIYALAIDGAVLSGARDNSIRVWEDGRCIQQLDAHAASVLALAARGGTAVSGSSDGSARVWRRGAAGYELERELRGHTLGVLAVAFDAHYIVTSSRDRRICVWRRDGTLEHVYAAHSSAVNACCIRGGHVASGGGDGRIFVFALADGATLAALDGPRCGIACIAYDGTHVYTGGSDGCVRVWSIALRIPIATFAAHTGLVRALSYDSARGVLATGGWDGRVRLWDVRAVPRGVPPRLLLDRSEHARVFATHMDAARLVSGGEARTLCVTDFGCADGMLGSART